MSFWNRLDGLHAVQLPINIGVGQPLILLFRTYTILYADDTVILSEAKEGMQQALDIFESYCEIWRLQVNVAKTKVMIFRKRKTAQDPKFILHGQTLDIVDTFSYLGCNI